MTTTLAYPLPPCFLVCVAQIKSAYRRLALQCHPDKTKGDPEVCQECRHISLPPVLHRGFARFLPTSCTSHLEAQQTLHPSSSSGIEYAKCMTRLLDSRPELERRHCMERSADGTGAHISLSLSPYSLSSSFRTYRRPTLYCRTRRSAGSTIPWARPLSSSKPSTWSGWD